MLDSTFQVWKDHDECIVLIALGRERTTSIRQEHEFDTPAQRQWLARRLDDIYRQLAGEKRPSIFQRARTFIRDILTGDDQ